MDARDRILAQSPSIGPSYGTVAKDAIDFADLVPVILPDFDDTLQWGPCRWQSRDDVSLPRRGDQCLVIFDNRHNPVIVQWWPFS